MKSIHAYYKGKVQGVGFRASVLSLAKGYEVTGWVKNLPDNRVELFVTGDEAETDDFLRGISESHLAGHIENISTIPGFPEAGIKGFRIIN
jgi:acylphosphatase